MRTPNASPASKRVLVPSTAVMSSVISPPVAEQRNAMVEPLLQVLRWYDSKLKKRPLTTKAFTNGITSAIGDTLAQILTTPTIDLQRTLAWAIAGWFYFGPILHVWYNGLAKFEKYLMTKHNATKTAAVICQIAFNQLIGATIVNACFLYFISFTKMALSTCAAGSFVAFNPAAAFGFATHQLHTRFPSMMLANFFFWPIPTFFNLTVVPLRWRVLFSNTCSIFWKCCLSIITSVR